MSFFCFFLTLQIFFVGRSREVESNASFGGSLNLTKSKAQETSQSFSINLENNTPGNLEKYAINSSYELIRLLQPFVENETSSPAAFNAAARNVIKTYLPEHRQV